MRVCSVFMELTQRQKQVLNFVKSFLKDKGYPPTRSEIAEHFGFLSITAAHGHLIALERKGIITIAAGISRGIAVIK